MSNDPSNNAGKKRRSKGRWLTVAAIAIIVFIVMITGAGLGFLTASIHTMPSLNGEIRPAASSQIFDINGKLIATIHSVENRLPVRLSKMPKDLQNAFIATEDARFYSISALIPGRSCGPLFPTSSTVGLRKAPARSLSSWLEMRC
jgi:penicillin-binding protein 1A